MTVSDDGVHFPMSRAARASIAGGLWSISIRFGILLLLHHRGVVYDTFDLGEVASLASVIKCTRGRVQFFGRYYCTRWRTDVRCGRRTRPTETRHFGAQRNKPTSMSCRRVLIGVCFIFIKNTETPHGKAVPTPYFK